MTPSEKLVLAALGTYTDSDGWCHPSQATLAERLGITRQTVSSSVKKLVLLGYVETQTRTAKGRGKVGYNYRVRLDLTPEEKADVKPSRLRDEPTSAPADFGADHDPMSAQPDIPYTEEQPHKNNPKDSCRKAPAKRLKHVYTEEFETFWKSWPDPVRERSHKPKSAQRWADARSRYDAELIMAAGSRYLSAPRTRKENYEYCCHAEVFLNGKLDAAVEAVILRRTEKRQVWSSASNDWVDA